MVIGIRILALACGVAFLLLGVVWTYWIALIGALFGGLSYGLLQLARRCERSAGEAVSVAQARLHSFVSWLLIVSAVTSVVALVITLLAN